MASCPTREQLQHLLADKLGEADRRSVTAHAETCSRCRQLLAELAINSVVHSPRRPTPADPAGEGPVTTAETVAVPPGRREGRGSSTPTNAGSDSRDSAAPAPHAGRTLGPYEVLEEIGHGGMGAVYKARQTPLGRTVAVKMIRAGELASPEQVARFRAEAELVARLDHPHIVPLYEVGCVGHEHYFAMKLIEGPSLADALAGGSWPGSAERARAAARLVEALARAVHYAHQHGILHRDLKPANVLLDRQGQPYITDFGVARRLDTPARLTVAGVLLGTPSYMAPEQAEGAANPTTAVDVHGLGAILYELLTGRPPFKGSTGLATLVAVRTEEPLSPRAFCPGLDRDLETICLKCLRKRPGERYGSAEALAEDLQHWLAGEPIRARRIGTVGRLVKWARRRPALAAAYGLVLLTGLLAVGAAGLTWLWLETDEQRRRTAEALTHAEEQRQEAELNRQRAVQARGDLARVSYRHRILLAHQAWRDNAAGETLRLLEDCPPELRGWEWHYLQRLCHQELLALPGNRGCSSQGVAIDPTGNLLAAAGGYGQDARLFDTLTGRPRGVLRHAAPRAQRRLQSGR